MTWQVLPKDILSTIYVVQNETELLTTAQLPVDVGEELGRVPRGYDQRCGLDVSVLGIQLSDDRGIDEKQISNKLDVTAGDGCVTVKYLYSAHTQFRCFQS